MDEGTGTDAINNHINRNPGERRQLNGVDLEVEQLKIKLTSMTEMCKQLLEHISRMESAEKMMKNQEKERSSALASPEDEKLEVDRLKEKLREVVQMNVNWQNFHSLQEKQLQELTDKVRHLEKELQTKSSGNLLPESQQIEFDRLLLIQKHKVQELEDEKIKLQDECVQLKQTIKVSQAKEVEQQKIISKLQASLNSQQPLPGEIDSERIQLLEAQLVMYREDFESERKDRERAQGKIAELEAKLEEEKRKQSFNQPTYPNRRGYGMYQLDVDAQDETDGDVSENILSSQVATSDSNSLRREENFDVLNCPRCKQMFTHEQHFELLDHLEECGSIHHGN